MADPLRPDFWKTLPLDALTEAEWEALCDGCGKCCQLKLEDEETGAVEYTRVACRLLDRTTCRCGDYANRKRLVPDCIVMDAASLDQHLYWLPASCAYKLRHQGKPLFDWHPLNSGTTETVHRARISHAGRLVSETEVDEDDLEDYLIAERL